MLDKISNLFKDGLEYTHTAGLLQQLANITNIVNAQYMKEATGKNQAIDYICEILQGHKDTVVELQRLPDEECKKCP
jgi:hypothetical protein